MHTHTNTHTHTHTHTHTTTTTTTEQPNYPKTSPQYTDTYRDEWREVFIISAEVYIFGALIFLILASGTVQPWATECGTEDRDNDHDGSEKSRNGSMLHDSLSYEDEKEKQDPPGKGVHDYGSVNEEKKRFT